MSEFPLEACWNILGRMASRGEPDKAMIAACKLLRDHAEAMRQEEGQPEHPDAAEIVEVMTADSRRLLLTQLVGWHREKMGTSGFAPPWWLVKELASHLGNLQTEVEG